MSSPVPPPPRRRGRFLRRLESLDARPSTAWAFALLLPAIVLVMLPTAWGVNEDFYFVQGLLKVAPAEAASYGIVFDTSNARLLGEWVIGYPVLWFGYDGAQVLLRLVMAAAYAASIAYCVTGLRLTPLDVLLTLALFLLFGPDIMGGEWLFQGVEPKTFAYACVFVGLGLAFRGRSLAAAVPLALATWFHFLVGGFWTLAAFGFVLLQGRDPRALLRPGALFFVLVLPVFVLLVIDRYVAGDAPLPPHGLSADYIYGIVRSAFHTAPFHDRFAHWSDGVVACLTLIPVLVFLATDAGRLERGLDLWVVGLLAYLLLAVGLSWFDRETGVLGKFFLFRPASLILLFAIAAGLLAVDRWFRAAPSRHRRLKTAAVLLIGPLTLWEAANGKLKDLVFGDPYGDLAELATFIDQHTPPGSVVISDPAADMERPGLSLPRVIHRPLLVTGKITPTNPAGIYEWYDLMTFKKDVFAGNCPGPDDPPVRYLILIEPDRDAPPPCGSVVWRSENFALVELPPAGLVAGGEPRARTAPDVERW